MQGFIDWFKKSRRNIYSGAEKTADELMSAIKFSTTPKVDLPQYSYIFRDPNTSGTELKNVACYRLGTKLYLGVQKFGRIHSVRTLDQFPD